jgi:hypothetical protein
MNADFILLYIDFSSDARLANNPSLYGNSDHLNAKGAAITSYLLLQSLIDNGLLPEKADGYDYD